MWRILSIIGTVALIAGGMLFAVAAFEPPRETDKPAPPPGAREVPGAAERGDRPPAPSAPCDAALENRILHGQVSLLNLIDALWLEEDQLEGIIAVLEPRMDEVEALAEDAVRLGSSPEFGAAMAELKETLMRGEAADEELRSRVNQWAGPGHAARLDFEALQREVAEEILPLLTENQLILLGEYKPCLFNQNDPLNPERVGQASAASRGVEMLRRLRQAPPAMREERLEHALGRLVDYSLKATPFTAEREAELDRLRALVDEVLALSDEEFDLRAEEYAKELMAFEEARDKLMADHYNLPAGAGMKDRTLQKLARNVVIPGALGIFEAELAARR